MKTARTMATLLLLVISLAHLLRVACQVQLVAGGVTIPMWASIVVSILFAMLAAMLWRGNKP
jgi:hypothetical protein